MSRHQYTIMVIEDEPLLLKAIVKKLEISGLIPLAFSRGDDAIRKLEKTTESPDAIWLDYYLKDMNGIEFMEKIQNNPKWSSIPVVVVSNSAGEENVHSMLSLGAKKYILKAEHRLEDIISSVTSHISEDNAHASTAKEQKNA